MILFICYTSDHRKDGGDMGDIGERIRKLRELRGWSQGKLAKESGVSRPLVNMVESGKRPNPTIDVVRALAKSLGISVGLLVGDEIKAASVA